MVMVMYSSCGSLSCCSASNSCICFIVGIPSCRALGNSLLVIVVLRVSSGYRSWASNATHECASGASQAASVMMIGEGVVMMLEETSAPSLLLLLLLI